MGGYYSKHVLKSRGYKLLKVRVNVMSVGKGGDVADEPEI